MGEPVRAVLGMWLHLDFIEDFTLRAEALVALMLGWKAIGKFGSTKKRK